jgi:glycosyltransferase involved in cell wall biosynthesis
MTFPVSACIITLNEEQNLDRCLASLDFIEDIIIVDSGSTDRTIEIAEKYNVRLYYRRFDNYINQKNYAISLTKNNWVISLDADEELSLPLKNEILSIRFDHLSDAKGFSMPRLTYYLKQWIYHSGWYPNTQVRLFDKRAGEFAGLLVHETVQLQGKILKLKNPIHHYSYRSISDHLKYIDKYSTLFAIEMFKKGKKSSLCKAIGKSFYKFWWMYIFRLGILDGRAGIIVCILGSYYNFLKYLKLFEIGRDKELASSLLVMVDSVHNIESQKASNKDCDKVHIG